MATIRKINLKSGVSYKVIIKDKYGNHLKSKNFSRLAEARSWAKRMEGDVEQMEALGMAGAGMTFGQLVDEFVPQWRGRDKSYLYRLDF